MLLMKAIMLAHDVIKAGSANIVVAGGMESMTQAPHLLPKSREGIKFGDVKLVDSMAYDALFDRYGVSKMAGKTLELKGPDLP